MYFLKCGCIRENFGSFRRYGTRTPRNGNTKPVGNVVLEMEIPPNRNKRTSRNNECVSNHGFQRFKLVFDETHLGYFRDNK